MLRSGGLDRIVDLARYPLGGADDRGADDRASDALTAAVAAVRRDLRELGCSVLTDFLAPAAQEALRREGAAVAGRARHETETVNVYNTAPDPRLPPGHPAHVVVLRGNAFVPRDRIPPATGIARLYGDPAFQSFVARCFGLPVVHELADPLAALCLNVLRPGSEHPWHFDTNELTVSMLIQAPAGGGVFEYCPGIRSPRDENVDAVGAVLAGRAPALVRRLELRPGDLQLFLGRYSLHRVSAVEGDVPRHSAIFAYSERPGVIGTPARTRQLFGRVTPAHLTAAGSSTRVDALLD